jgi:hypothetical protein
MMVTVTGPGAHSEPGGPWKPAPAAWHAGRRRGTQAGGTRLRPLSDSDRTDCQPVARLRAAGSGGPPPGRQRTAGPGPE